PLVLHEEALDTVVCRHLRLTDDEPDLRSWEALVDRVDAAQKPVRVGLIGKYVSLLDAYLSVVEALKHGGFHHGAKVEIDWIQAEEVEGLLAAGRLRDLDGIVIPGGFGERGGEGKIAAAGYAREQGIPCLGLCLGMHVMTIDFARNVCGLTGANTSEFDPQTPHPVIDLLESQRDVTSKGGTMRLGAYFAELAPGSTVAAAYGGPAVFGAVARRPPRRIRRARQPPVLGGHAGPSRVQEPSGPSGSALPRVHRRRAGSRRRSQSAPLPERPTRRARHGSLVQGAV